jgi:hypothetical protein
MRIKKTSDLRRLCIALGGERLKDKLQKEQRRSRAFGYEVGMSKQSAPLFDRNMNEKS